MRGEVDPEQQTLAKTELSNLNEQSIQQSTHDDVVDTDGLDPEDSDGVKYRYSRSLDHKVSFGHLITCMPNADKTDFKIFLGPDCSL